MYKMKSNEKNIEICTVFYAEWKIARKSTILILAQVPNVLGNKVYVGVVVFRIPFVHLLEGSLFYAFQ